MRMFTGEAQLEALGVIVMVMILAFIAFVVINLVLDVFEDTGRSYYQKRAVAEMEKASKLQKENHMKLRQYRQGDVWIREVLKPNAEAWSAMQKVAGKITDAAVKLIPRDKGRVILAYGEETGHAHAIMDKTTEFFQCDDGRRILLVKDEKTTLSHEEHAPITIPKGEYEIVQQREYDPELHSVQVLD